MLQMRVSILRLLVYCVLKIQKVLDLQIQRIRTEYYGEAALEPNVIMVDLNC